MVTHEELLEYFGKRSFNAWKVKMFDLLNVKKMCRKGLFMPIHLLMVITLAYF
jgi:hypothetical protein